MATIQRVLLVRLFVFREQYSSFSIDLGRIGCKTVRLLTRIFSRSKDKHQDVKKMVMTALSLPWNDDGLFSPVKRNPNGASTVSKRPVTPLKLILLLGNATGDSPSSIINSQIQKMLNSIEIQIIHVAEKVHFTSIPFVNSSIPLAKVTKNEPPLIYVDQYKKPPLKYKDH